MNSRRIRRTAGFVGVAALVLTGGLLTGSYLGRHRSEASRSREKANLQGFLESNLRGIEIGKSFPDIPLWPADGAEACMLSELVPHGGIIFCVSSACSSCIDAVEALHAAELSLRWHRLPIVLICDPNPAPLMAAMEERHIDLKLYADFEDRLSVDFNLRTTRTYFVLGPERVLKRMGIAGFNPEEYTSILTGSSQ